MKRTWLVFDMHGLAYRAFHALGELSYEGELTEVAYGIFRDVRTLRDQHQATGLVFAFDGGYDKRTEICPEYKHKRREELTDEEKEARRQLRNQIFKLRTKYLPDIGYQNILWQEGYEADDHIAKVCDILDRTNEVIIVSEDKDLYQLLVEKRVMIWNPRKKKMVTESSFRIEWGVPPCLWSDVKAIAGCPTDNVPGVKGVGEKTAIKFLSGSLKQSSKSYAAIVANNALWERNLHLVRLPMYGVNVPKLRTDKVDEKDWRRVMDSLGIKSLR